MSSDKLSSLADAYAVLGLTQGCSLDQVKARYRQIALRTHPDKNPNNPDATVQFQHVSEAYRQISMHIDSEDGNDIWDDYDSSDDEIPLELYLWLFSRLVNGRMYSRSYEPYRQQAPAQRETLEEYRERQRRTMEERRQAEERRKREDEASKRERERQRETERHQAKERQQHKKAAKKAQAKAKTQKAEQTAQTLQERAQTLRSRVFQAAREKNSAKVKEGIYEFSVDASGGEARVGCEKFVKILPEDPQETLLHIATKNGDADLVEYLDRHNAEPDERNSDGFTPVHLALQAGNLSIIFYFFKMYPPKDPDHASIYRPPDGQMLLTYALRLLSPPLADLVLANELASAQDIKQAWDWANSLGFMTDINKDGSSAEESGKLKDILTLFVRYGGFSSPPETESARSGTEFITESNTKLDVREVRAEDTCYQQGNKYHTRGRGRDRMRG
ncbi:hypothetical protein APHAL10511_001049 [Amanita phalloides]|nr:hypothetical protein APHAL10511_001049 [Amanita phalloides]